MLNIRKKVLSTILITSMLTQIGLVSMVSAAPLTTTVSPVTTNQTNTNTAHRITGANRYATSDAMSEKFTTADTVIIANGEDFPDAISISETASQLGMPILLVDKSGLSESQKDFIKASGITSNNEWVVLLN